MIQVNGRETPWQEGMTIRDVMKARGYTAPRIIVKVNGELVRQERWDTHQINDGDDVQVLHMVAGG
jgi:thiamine biosynthesis protein ThiS